MIHILLNQARHANSKTAKRSVIKVPDFNRANAGVCREKINSRADR